MKLVAYKALCLSTLLALVLACADGTIHAQSERPGDQSIEPGGQAGSI